MPPRYAYWTILVDDQPTAFRASAQEDLMPTLKRLQARNPSAKMMWWQNGKLWERRVDAQEAMYARGELGRRGDSRQEGSGFRDRERRSFRDRSDAGKRTAWTARGAPSTPPPARNADDKLEWKPKGEFVPAPKRADNLSRRSGGGAKADRPERADWKPGNKRSSEWRPKSSDREERPQSFTRSAYKPSGDDSRSAKPAWKPKGSTFAKATVDRSFDRGEKPAWKPKGSFNRESRPAGKLDWKPKGESSDVPSGKRKWVPKEEYKKSQGIEARRDKNWRPGGSHKDPRQKYKDAKKAKWMKFKKAIRTRSESKGKKKDE